MTAADGLAHCFRAFPRRGPQQLDPLGHLRSWMEKTVRLDPRSRDTKVLLPEVADHAAQIDAEKGASRMMLSTLHSRGYEKTGFAQAMSQRRIAQLKTHPAERSEAKKDEIRARKPSAKREG
jgi:hypothetical protein